MARPRRIGEFELIARYFAPLARTFKGAGNLQSDNAFLAANARYDLVVKTDTIVAGVHFLADEQPQRVAAKALRVCLSDLAPAVLRHSSISSRSHCHRTGPRHGSRPLRKVSPPTSGATASSCAAAIRL